MFSLLVTGILRETEIFELMLREWLSMPVEEIVISTWADERQKFETFFSELGLPLPPVRYALNDEPCCDIGPPRNYLRQVHTLLNGLLACSQTHVFKIRTDFFASAALWPKLEQTSRSEAEGPLRAYGGKIWTPWVDYEEPFHIADEAMFGARADLLKLCGGNIADLCAFGYPLVDNHSLLYRPKPQILGRMFRDILRAQKTTGASLDDDSPAKFVKLGNLLAKPSYQRLIALYHRHLLDNFTIGCPPGLLVFRPATLPYGIYYSCRQLDDAAAPDLFTPEFRGFANHFYAWSEESLARLVAATRQNPAFLAYHLAYEQPAPWLRLADDSAYDEFVAALVAARDQALAA